MRTRLVLVVGSVLAAGGALAAGAASAPLVSAPVYLVESGLDGSTLAARAPERRHAIASITKLMTVLVALERHRLDEVVTVPPAATRIGESTLDLRPGERLTVRDLAIGALLPSANDAATALALHAGGGSLPRFVALMNARARSLGLRSTRFANPHGLDAPGHYSTARDVAALLHAATANRFVRRWAGRERATIAGGREVETTNDLLRALPAVVAGKTGQTDGAGWSEVAAARANGVTITAVLLGGSSRATRNAELEALLRWGLDRYRRATVVDARRTYAIAEPGWGMQPLALRAPSTIVRPVYRGRPLVERVVAPRVVALPVRRGQALGEVVVLAGDRIVARAPLVATRDVAQPGLAAKARFVAGRTFHHLAGFVS